jgi:hypothetical protein
MRLKSGGQKMKNQILVCAVALSLLLLLVFIGCGEKAGEAFRTTQKKATPPTTIASPVRPQVNATQSLPANNTPVLNISAPKVNYTAMPINYSANATRNATNTTNVTMTPRVNYTYSRMNMTANTTANASK